MTGTAGLSLLLKPSVKVQFSLPSVFYDPRQKGGEVGQEKHPHQKEGSFGFVGGRKLVASRSAMKEGPGQGTGII